MANNSSRDPTLIKPLDPALAEQFQRWHPPNVDFSPGYVEDVDERDVRPLTAEQIEAIQRQAYQEAYDKGLAKGVQDGLKQGQNLIRQRSEQFDRLINALAAPFTDLDKQVEKEVVSLAILVARHIIRREIKSDPGQIVAAVREAIALLPVGARDICLKLHPEDASLIREVMSLSEEGSGWRLSEDPTLTRGGCRVVTENSQIDATLESRLSAVIAQALGGEREQDHANA